MIGRSGVASTVFAGVLLCGCGALPAHDLVIRGVQVVDVDAGTAVYADVGIDGDRIAAVSATPLRGRAEFDGSGLWAIPGLWDMHVHVADPIYFDLMIANGVLGARDMGGDSLSPGAGCGSVAIERLREWRRQIESGERIGPRLVLAGPPVVGGRWAPAAAADEARDAVRRAARRGADFVKVHEGIPPDAFDALMREARAAGLHVAGHVAEDTLSVLDALRAGQRSVEHVRSNLIPCFARDEAELEAFYAQDGWSAADRAWGAARRAECHSIWRELRLGRAWLSPTLAVEKTRLDAVLPGFADDPRRRGLPASVRAGVAAHAAAMRERTPARQREQEHWWRTQLAFAARAHAEGARLLSGSDAACEGVIPGYGLHDQLALLVEAGLPPLAALRTATLEPAAYLGREDRSGRVAPKFDADLVLLRSDPRVEIGAVRHVEAVVVRGRLLDRDALRARR